LQKINRKGEFKKKSSCGGVAGAAVASKEAERKTDKGASKFGSADGGKNHLSGRKGTGSEGGNYTRLIVK